MHSTERLRIETPEQVTLELPLAGIGSRFLAIVIDTLLQLALGAAALVVLVVGVFTIGVAGLRFNGPSGSVLLALVLLAMFCIYWGYFALFEIFWMGQTPGKRWAGIRVIKDSGRPIDVYSAAARNLLRAIDFLPAFYFAGITCMILNRHSRRIGDFVAGTVVVHDRRPEAIASVVPPPSPAPPGPPAVRITAEELVLIETYLQRKADLAWDVQEQTALRIARRIFERTGAHVERGQNVDDFLEALARHARDAARFGADRS